MATGAGVMCLNFHPQHPNLLALGCYDGSVNVYDVRKGTKPLYTSTAATGKHTDPVWEIFWQVGKQNRAESQTLVQPTHVASTCYLLCMTVKQYITHIHDLTLPAAVYM